MRFSSAAARKRRFGHVLRLGACFFYHRCDGLVFVYPSHHHFFDRPLQSSLKRDVPAGWVTSWTMTAYFQNYTDCRQSLLQDVFFVEKVSQSMLAALGGGETTAGMLRSDAVRVAHVCSGFMVMRFFCDMKKIPWALCFCDIDSNMICLEALEGEISKLVA